MDFRKLEIFAAVARELSFSRAAQVIPMAQPAVSIAVNKLEQELGCLLFERQGRSISLTAEGQRLLEQANRVLEQVAGMKASVNRMQNLLEGELTIACPSMLATYYLPELLSEFLSMHPGLKASVAQAGTRRIEQMLLDNQAELGVITVRPGELNPDLELYPLVDEQIMLCMSDKHPWAGRREVTAKALHEQPMVVYESGYFIRERFDQLSAMQGIQPDFRMQTDFLPLIVRMVKQQLGMTLGLAMMAEQEAGLTGVPFKPRERIIMAIAKRKSRNISLANQAFVDWVIAGL